MDYAMLTEEGNIDTLKEICDIIQRMLPCEIICESSPGIMKISHLDTHEKTHRHIGETKATYCEVEVDGNAGFGCIQGYDAKRALYAALIDSVMFNNHPITSYIAHLLDELENQVLEKWVKQRMELYV
jgi:alpha-D-ribose 1-methylphosphonate 5-triphosphate synthase subunit PhnG